MTQPIYRFHCAQKTGFRFHFSPKPEIGDGWTPDGIAFYVPLSGPATVPVHQFHYDQKSTYGGWRFNFNITMNPTNQGWTYDSSPFFAYPSQVEPNLVPVYQYHYDQTDGCRFHFSTGEKPGK